MGITHVCDALHLYHNIHMDPIVWFWIITLESVVTPFIKISTITVKQWPMNFVIQ